MFLKARYFLQIVHYCPHKNKPPGSTGGCLGWRGAEEVATRYEGQPYKIAILACASLMLHWVPVAITVIATDVTDVPPAVRR